MFATRDDGLQLTVGSPLIDTGNNVLIAPVATRDIKNDLRIYGAKVDLGAYELSCAPGNTTATQQLTVCKGNRAFLQVNSATLPQNISWYADSLGTTMLDTGYTYTTPALMSTDTFWVSALGCSDSIRIPIRVFVPKVASFIQVDSTLKADSGATAYQWLICNPYQVIPGANTSTYTPTQNGSYTVAMTQNGCTDTAACLTVSGLGIGIGPHNNPDILLFRPNPTQGIVVLSTGGNLNNATLYVTNMQGEVIYRMLIDSGKSLVVDLSTYPSGLYYFVVSNGGRYYSGKLIKQ